MRFLIPCTPLLLSLSSVLCVNPSSVEYVRPSSLREVMDTASSRIKHVFVLMMENRSFDHMLGWLKEDYNENLEGLTEGMTVPRNPNDPSKGTVPVTRAGYDVGPDDPLHDYLSIHAQIDSNSMDGFVYSAISHGHNETNPVRMFDNSTAPVLNTLAQEFAVFDHWFCSVPGPTDPNRGYVMSGTSQGVLHNFDGNLWPQQSYFDLLTSNNHTFRAYYQQDIWSAGYFKDMQKPINSQYLKDLDTHFYADLAAGDMGEYVWLQPRLSPHDNLPTWQHPDASVVEGERLIKQIYEALRVSPIWNETLLIITYDEHGGFYDHVAPPVNAPNPDGIPNANGFNFDQLGLRVPTVVVSPWIAKNTIVSKPFPNEQPTTTSQYESTSIMATAHAILGLTDANVPLLGKRASWANTFLGVVSSLSEPRNDCPMILPSLPATDLQSSLAEQRSKPNNDHLEDQLTFYCIHNHGDAHSRGECEGRPEKLKTQGEAADWIKTQTEIYVTKLRLAESIYFAQQQSSIHNVDTEIAVATV